MLMREHGGGEWPMPSSRNHSGEEAPAQSSQFDKFAQAGCVK
jgi:hypothetical protein